MRMTRDGGSAVVVALVVLVLVSSLGLGLVLTTALEPAMAAAHEASLAALYAAEAGIETAAHELAAVPEWDLILSGQVRSGLFDSDADARVVLPDGSAADFRAMTNTINCGRTDACSSSELDAYTADRPWGPNNPRWQFFGHARLDGLLPPGARATPAEVAVWVADDPADIDRNPLRDTPLALAGGQAPGAGMVAVRADGFGLRSARRTIVVTVARPRWVGDPRQPVVAWREMR